MISFLQSFKHKIILSRSNDEVENLSTMSIGINSIMLYLGISTIFQDKSTANIVFFITIRNSERPLKRIKKKKAKKKLETLTLI